MYFTNDKQARAFLDDYRNWPNDVNDLYMDRRRFGRYFKRAYILVEETQYSTFFYNGRFNDTESSQWGHPVYYIMPDGLKKKPMSSYCVKISEAVRLLRQIDKDYTDGSD